MADDSTGKDMTAGETIVHGPPAGTRRAAGPEGGVGPRPAGFQHARGPRSLAALLPSVTKATFRRHSPAAAQIMADWLLIVGPTVASMTTPRRLDRGTLTIACSGPVAMNLHYVGVELINRINTHLGGRPLHSLRFTQAGMPRQPLPPPRPPPEAVAAAEAAVADLPDGDLRSALAALGRVVLGRSQP